MGQAHSRSSSVSSGSGSGSGSSLISFANSRLMLPKLGIALPARPAFVCSSSPSGHSWSAFIVQGRIPCVERTREFELADEVANPFGQSTFGEQVSTNENE